MKSKKIRKGTLLIITGLILILAAFILAGYNIWDEYRAAGEADRITDMLYAQMDSQEGTPPDYLLNPDMEMPVITVDGNEYIGTVSIPELQMELPVISEWSYEKLKTAPCRYSGSVYKDDMVLAAHNYTSHFGRLKNLSVGDKVIFTDAVGNVFEYRVAELDVLNPTAIEDMVTGDWDLTLFTCTIGGQTRIAVRCEREQSK